MAGKLWINSRVSPEGCWRWIGAHGRDGYGDLWDGERVVDVHRLAYESWVGPIPEGLQIDHVKERGCAHRDCVNPAHLEAVTQLENIRRGSGVSVVAARKTHCKYGHEFTPENTGRTSDGYRQCMACQRRRNRSPRARNVAARNRAEGRSE